MHKIFLYFRCPTTTNIPGHPSGGKKNSHKNSKPPHGSNESVGSTASHGSTASDITAGSLSSTATNSSKLLAFSYKRLIARIEFLQSFLPPLDACIQEVGVIYQGYQYSVAKRLKYADLTFERSKLDDSVSC